MTSTSIGYVWPQKISHKHMTINQRNLRPIPFYLTFPPCDMSYFREAGFCHSCVCFLLSVGLMVKCDPFLTTGADNCLPHFLSEWGKRRLANGKFKFYLVRCLMWTKMCFLILTTKQFWKYFDILFLKKHY